MADLILILAWSIGFVSLIFAIIEIGVYLKNENRKK